MEARRYRCTAAMLEDTIVHLCKRLLCLLWCSVCFSVRYRGGCRAKSLTDGLKECCFDSNPRFSGAHVVPRACACLTTPLGLDCYLRLDISRLVACYQKHVHSSIYVHRTRPRVPCSDVIGGAVPVSVRVIICCGLTTRVTISALHYRCKLSQPDSFHAKILHSMQSLPFLVILEDYIRFRRRDRDVDKRFIGTSLGEAYRESFDRR